MPNQYVNKVVQRNGNTLIDISDTTAVASDVASGKYFYLASGEKVVGTASSTPSATAHTIVFEFSDETSTTLTGYWDGTFISDAIRATTPTSYGGKTVATASLDGVTWYEQSAGTWETIYNGTLYPNPNGDEYNSYWWQVIEDTVEPIEVGSRWRITWAGTVYYCIAKYSSNYSTYVGNPGIIGGPQDESNAPFWFNYIDWGQPLYNGDTTSNSAVQCKIERLVTE